MAPADTARTIFTTPATSITMRRVQWLWKDRIPLGMFSLLAGREGIGKSCLAIEIAARVTTGALDGDQDPAPVFYVAAEDSWEHTVKPRFKAAGADLKLVHQIQVRQGESITDPSFPIDIAELERKINELGVRLIVLDPFISRLDGGLDTHKDSDVRRALEPLVGLAERTGAAILGIIHVSKADTTDPLTSVMGSKAFAAVARAVLYASEDGDTCLLSFEKSNLGPKQRSYSYTIKGVTVGSDPDDKLPITAGAVEWVGQSDRRAADVLEDRAAASRPRSKRDLAKALLLAQLAAGPLPAQAVTDQAIAAGIPASTLDRAARDLNVVRVREGFGGGSTWALPDGGAGRPLAGELPAADSQAAGDDPQAAASHSHQPPRARVSDLNDVNDLNNEPPPSPLCDSNDLNDLNDLNDSNGTNDHLPASVSHSHHSHQSGHSGGDETGGMNGDPDPSPHHQPGEAGPAQPDAAGTAARVDAPGTVTANRSPQPSPPPPPPDEPLDLGTAVLGRQAAANRGSSTAAVNP